MEMLKRTALSIALLFALGGVALSQTASINATTTTSRVALPESTNTYPFVKVGTQGGAPKTYFNLGTSGVEASPTGQFLAAGGNSYCMPVYMGFPGVAWNVAAMTDSGTATVTITQQASCP
jgi:hypothetical protein